MKARPASSAAPRAPATIHHRKGQYARLSSLAGSYFAAFKAITDRLSEPETARFPLRSARGWAVVIGAVVLAAGLVPANAQRLLNATFGAADQFSGNESAQSLNFRMNRPTFETFAGIAVSDQFTMQIGWLPTTVEDQLPPAAIAVNDLDALSDVTALHGETLEFLVSATNLTGGLDFTLDSSSPTAQSVKGAMSLTPYGAGRSLFRYTPSADDLVGFNLTITAGDAQGNKRSAEFTVAPYPILPAEESFIKSVIPAPDPESGDFVTRTRVESLVDEPWFGSSRKTLAVAVAAKSLILAAGHPNRVFESYDAPDQIIKTFDVYAERVVLRTSMRLQGATITIYARELIYENDATFLDAKQVTHVSGPIKWLQPPTLRIILAYVRDLYISGRGREARAILMYYSDFLDGLTASAAWADYSEEGQNEFEQMHGEIVSMLWNLDRNLDYFGNPAGWVPNLSYEVNLGIFSSEIESAIRLMYLSYWLGRVAKDLEAKSAAMTATRTSLHEEILAMATESKAIQDRLPELEEHSRTLSAEIVDLQQRIKDREEALRREYDKSRKKNKWRNIAKQAGAIMTVFPVGQPVLGAIGTGLNVLSSLDKNSSLGDWQDALEGFKGIAGEFTSAKFKESWDSFTQYGEKLEKIDPRKVSWNIDGLKEYYKDVNELRKEISSQVKRIEGKLKVVELSDRDVQTKQAGLKVAAPEFGQRNGDGILDGLMDAVAQKVAEQRELANEITESIRSMNRLADTIHRDILAMDALSQDISKSNGALNLRASTYLKDIETRAKERLLKYQYYMAKALEYRLLSAYQGDLNLGTMFDKLVALAEADPSGDGRLSGRDFAQLKGIYEEQVALIAESLVDRYNREPHGWTDPFTYALTANQIDSLNRGEPVAVNLAEGCFSQDREDAQINEMHIDMKVSGAARPNDTFSLRVTHSGVSRMKRGTDVFLFRHNNISSLNPFQRDHPFRWQAQYDSNTGEVTERSPGRGDVSLLRFLLDLRGASDVDAKVNLFTRAGLWSDFTLQRSDSGAGTLARYRIEEVMLHGSYDYRDQPGNLMSLDVSTANTEVHPVIKADRTDFAGRRDGVRRFHRTYGRNPGSQVALTAPDWYGYWKFDRWTDCEGNELGTNATLALPLDANKRVQVHYVNTDSDGDSMPDSSELAWFGSLDEGMGNDWDGDRLGNYAEMMYGTDPSLRDTDGDGIDDGAEIAADSDPTSITSIPLNIGEMTALGHGLLRLRWHSEPGAMYIVERSANLAAAVWEELAQVRSLGATSEITLETEGSQYFFRLTTAGDSPVVEPRILMEPVDVTVKKGGRATLSVSATGTESLSYQWYRGRRGDTGDAIPAANEATLITPPLSETTEYWIRVRNSAGSADSRTVTVIVERQQYSPMEAYVPNADTDTVTVVTRDAMDLLARVPVGNRPTGLIASPDGSWVFVVNHRSGSVSVIDSGLRRVAATIGVGEAPLGMAISRDGRRLYVANSGSLSISVIDTADQTVITTVPTPMNPTTLAFHPVRDEIWLGYGPLLEARSAANHNILASAIASSHHIAATALTFLPDGSEAFGVESCGCCGRFHRISGTHSKGLISIMQTGVLEDGSGAATCAAVNRQTGIAYLAKTGHCIESDDPRVYEFDTGRSVGLDAAPRAMSVDEKAGELWVAQGNGVALIIDTESLAVTAKVNVGSDPQGIAFIRRGVDLPTDALEIAQQPMSQTVIEGTTATFNLSVRSAEPLTYQWQKGETNLVDGVGIAGANTATLTLVNVRTSDAGGSYRCVVRSEHGTVTSRWVSLLVNKPYLPEVSSATTTHRHTAQGEFIDVVVRLPDFCHRVSSWGSAAITGQHVVAEAAFQVTHGGVCAQAVQVLQNTYDLGQLSPGRYEFSFRVHGYQIQTLSFQVL